MKLIATVGLPGSGKSTWALEQVAASGGMLARVNRDDIREELHGGEKWTPAREKVTVAERDRRIREAFSQGKDVVVDDTGFGPALDQLSAIAKEFGADFEVKKFDVDLHTCIERDRIRGARGGRMVGEKVIRSMWEKFVFVPNPDQDPSLPHCILVDMDGTLAIMGDRSPYDDARAYEDTVNLPVAKMVNAYLMTNPDVTFIVMSGRDDGRARGCTQDWLEDYFVKPDFLYMRAAGDMRHDNIIKHELYDAHIRGKYFVDWVADDRDQVVRLWRDTLGLPCFQVGWGAF